MRMYLIGVMGLCFATDALLLMGTGKMTGQTMNIPRLLLAALLGAVYGGICLLPGLPWAGIAVCRLLVLMAIGWTSFGHKKGGLVRCGLYLVLKLTVDGLSFAMGGGQNVLLAAVAVCVFLLLKLAGNSSKVEYIPVELYYGDQRIQMRALRDTGNGLRDPVSGEDVLVVGAKMAESLLGLSRHQLEDPVGTMAACPIPGLRLIPYRSVGVSGGMLLALRMDRVRIGNRWRSAVVAFAPAGLDGQDGIEALTGGAA